MNTVSIKRLELLDGYALLILTLPVHLRNSTLALRLLHLREILRLDELSVTNFATDLQFIYVAGDGDLLSKAHAVAYCFMTLDRVVNALPQPTAAAATLQNKDESNG